MSSCHLVLALLFYIITIKYEVPSLVEKKRTIPFFFLQNRQMSLNFITFFQNGQRFMFITPTP